MCLDAALEGFWIFQDSEYPTFLNMPELHKDFHIPEYS